MADLLSSNEDLSCNKVSLHEKQCPPTMLKRNLHLTRLSLPRRSLPSSAFLLGVESSQELLPWSQSQRAKASLLSVLSALYALVLVILALAFEVSGLVADEVVATKYNLFYIYLYLVGLAFFAYCYAFLLRTKDWNVVLPFQHNKRSFKTQTPDDSMLLTVLQPTLSTRRKVTHSAKVAGSFYLRLGALVFGIVGVIDRAMQAYRILDQGPIAECYDYVNIAEDIIAIVFIFVQLYFIFQNSKMTIHRFKEVGRFGSMHLIATNLSLWIKAVVAEEYYMIQEISHSFAKGDKLMNATHRHSFFSRTHTAHSEEISVMLNYTCGHLRKESVEMIRNAKPFMTTCIIEYALICAAVMYILWRNIGYKAQKRSKFRKQNFQIDCSSSMNGLFVGLMFLVFTLVSMIIFFTKVHMERNIEALWLFYLSDCLLYIVSIGALSAGMYRMRNLYHISNGKGVLLDDILLYVGLVGQLMFCIFSVVALTKFELLAALIVVVSLCRMIEVLLQTVFILFAQRLVALTPRMQIRKPGREMITFLLMSNLAMFLINIFETQKAGTNPLTVEFYGESFWTVIVHSTVPLSIFYRFHSSVCFAEIWKRTYRFKEPEIHEDDGSRLEHADEPYRKFWQEMFEGGYLNKTAVIFMSDHGHRFMPMRKTLVGLMEELNLFIRVWFPE